MADRGECLVGLDFIGGHYRLADFRLFADLGKRGHTLFDPRGVGYGCGQFWCARTSGGNADYLGYCDFFGFAGEYWHCHVLDRIGASVAASPIGHGN